MDEQANVSIVRQCYGAFARGDIAGLRSYVADDVTWETPAVPGMHFTGCRQGCEEVMAFFAEMAAAQRVEQFTPGEFISQGSRVVVLGHYQFTVKASGARYASDWVHIFTVRDGKVAAFREFLDTHAAQAAYR